MSKVLSLACATVAIGLPLAVLAIVWGGKALVFALQLLPQG